MSYLPHITVCCCTYRRPQLLSYVLWCFERQDYPFRSMIVLDDSGLLEPVECGRWKIVSTDQRYDTLGMKRNACAKLAAPSTDVLVFWDDDDLYLPWGLSATAHAMTWMDAEWSRPSLFCFLTKDEQALWRCRTWGRADRQDKACQCGWGISRQVFWDVGGYPSHLSVGEDKQLAIKLTRAGVVECDPNVLYPPWYVWGPWGNRHVSEPAVDYHGFDGGVEPGGDGRVRVWTPPVPLERLPFLPDIGPRGFSGDWYEDVER